MNIKHSIAKGLLFVILVSCIITSIGCHYNEKSQQNSDWAGYLNSREFKEYLKGESDSSTIASQTISLFKNIGEESFLYSSNYHYYIVYIISPFSSSVMNVYTLKSGEGKALATHKVFNKEELQLNEKGNVAAIKSISENSKKISGNQEKEIIAGIEDCIRKFNSDSIKYNERYDIPYTALVYFDGKNYYRLNGLVKGSEEMLVLDSVFKSSPLFKK